MCYGHYMNAKFMIKCKILVIARDVWWHGDKNVMPWHCGVISKESSLCFVNMVTILSKQFKLLSYNLMVLGKGKRNKVLETLYFFKEKEIILKNLKLL